MEYLKEEFNCSEDYFEDVTVPRKGGSWGSWDCSHIISKCKVCGWSFKFTYSEKDFGSDVVDKMRDHVYLKHICDGEYRTQRKE